METFSALLALCAGNSPVPVNSPHKGQWRGALVFSFICVRINDWLNNRAAGDLRRHRGHYHVNVMITLKATVWALRAGNKNRWILDQRGIKLYNSHICRNYQQWKINLFAEKSTIAMYTQTHVFRHVCVINESVYYWLNYVTSRLTHCAI